MIQNDKYLDSQIGSYVFLQMIGKGAFGKVYRGVCTITNQIVALKIIDKILIQNQKNQKRKAYLEKLIKLQYQILTTCNSQYIIKCYQRLQNQQIVLLVLEYCNDGNLFNHIKSNKKLPQKEAIVILKQLIQAFSQFHSKNIIHRDIKPENIFKNYQKFKIGDLGFAKILSQLSEVSFQTKLGTSRTMAPQVSKKMKYGTKADLWSLGIVYYEMLYGQTAFPHMTVNQIQKHKINLSQISEQSRDFLSRILVINPDKRMSWEEVYQHKLLKKNSDFDLQIKLKDTNLSYPQIEGNLQQQLQRYEEQPDINYEQVSKIHKVPISEIKKLKDLCKTEQKIKQYIDIVKFQKQKSLVIFQQIFLPLQHNHMGLKRDRFMCQFLYLIISHLYFISSQINATIIKAQNSINQKNKIQFEKYKEISPNYQNIKQYFNMISDQLSKIDSKYISIAFDFSKKWLKNDQFKKKQMFLTGIFDKDFSAQQQAQYTKLYYIPQILKKLDDRKSIKQIEFKNYLQDYKTIILLNYLQKEKLYAIKASNSKRKFRPPSPSSS